MKLNSKKAKKLFNTDLIIWDEAPMTSKHILRCIDNLLQDINQNTVVFGSKHLVLGGDFRQIAPVVHKGDRSKIIENSIKSCKLWNEFKILKLNVNMRADPNEKEFSKWLLDLGDGKLPVIHEEDMIRIPAKCIKSQKYVHLIV
jgi:hypothetical protein